MSSFPRVRCAIDTRKSSDEGLEQSFNSLDAQREACSAYILSQTSEGWMQVAETYDAGRIDIVVVYKVDRRTRELVVIVRRHKWRAPRELGAIMGIRSPSAVKSFRSYGKLAERVDDAPLRVSVCGHYVIDAVWMTSAPCFPQPPRKICPRSSACVPVRKRTDSDLTEPSRLTLKRRLSLLIDR